MFRTSLRGGKNALKNAKEAAEANDVNTDRAIFVKGLQLNDKLAIIARRATDAGVKSTSVTVDDQKEFEAKLAGFEIDNMQFEGDMRSFNLEQEGLRAFAQALERRLQSTTQSIAQFAQLGASLSFQVFRMQNLRGATLSDDLGLDLVGGLEEASPIFASPFDSTVGLDQFDDTPFFGPGKTVFGSATRRPGPDFQFNF